MNSAIAKEAFAFIGMIAFIVNIFGIYSRCEYTIRYKHFMTDYTQKKKIRSFIIQYGMVMITSTLFTGMLAATFIVQETFEVPIIIKYLELIIAWFVFYFVDYFAAKGILKMILNDFEE